MLFAGQRSPEPGQWTASDNVLPPETRLTNGREGRQQPMAIRDRKRTAFKAIFGEFDPKIDELVTT